MTKHRQQSARVRAERMDLIGSQVCSSLLHPKQGKKTRKSILLGFDKDFGHEFSFR